MDGSSTALTQERAQQVWQEYQLGLTFFRTQRWRAAARHFALAEQKSFRHDVQQRLYRSYHGVALVFSGDISGLNLCRHTAAREKRQATVFHNLALAEIRLRHRRRACDAIALGLQLDPLHAGLLKLRHDMGVRRNPCLPFLKRDNPLNKWLGKATYGKLGQGKATR